jgi:hypothetical protein
MFDNVLIFIEFRIINSTSPMLSTPAYLEYSPQTIFDQLEGKREKSAGRCCCSVPIEKEEDIQPPCRKCAIYADKNSCCHAYVEGKEKVPKP